MLGYFLTKFSAIYCLPDKGYPTRDILYGIYFHLDKDIFSFSLIKIFSFNESLPSLLFSLLPEYFVSMQVSKVFPNV